MAEVADLGARRAGAVRAVVAGDGEGALVGAQQGREHPQEGALARPVRAQHREALTGREPDVHAIDRPALAEALHQAVGPDELRAPYSVTSARTKARNTTASRAFDCAKAAGTRARSPPATIVFSYSSTSAQTPTPTM